MKSKKFIALACALASTTVLVACSGEQKINFTANWQSNTTGTEFSNLSTEQLSYDVTFDEGKNMFADSYSVSYENGKYETKLTGVTKAKATEEIENFELLQGEEKNLRGTISTDKLYRYETTFSIDVQYVLKKTGETSETFTDSVKTVAYFKGAANGLTPIYSHKELICKSPVGSDVSKLNQCYVSYHLTTDIDYTAKKAASTIRDYEGTYLRKEKDAEFAEKTSTFTPSSEDYTYLDNEQLLFAIRGMGTSATSFSVYQAPERTKKKIDVTVGKKTGYTVKAGILGEKEKNVHYRAYTLTYDSANPGGAQVAWIANTTDADDNTNRNVMLRLETPLGYNIGSLVYTLKSAKFLD